MKWIIPYAGHRWEFDDSRITAAEARLQKRLCDGATPAAASTARFDLDPDALVAALVIARRRAGLPAEEAIIVDDELIDLTEVAEATAEAAKGLPVPEAAPDPAVVEGEIVRAKRPRKAADPA